jgi:hypothetical protein
VFLPGTTAEGGLLFSSGLDFTPRRAMIPVRIIHTEATVCPAQHVPCQPFVEEGVLQKVGDHAGAEVLTELRQIEGWHVDRLSLPVESAFQEDGVQMGIEPDEVSRRGISDHSCALDLSSGRLVVESLDHPINELADLPVESPVVAEKNTEHLGKVGAVVRPGGKTPYS